MNEFSGTECSACGIKFDMYSAVSFNMHNDALNHYIAGNWVCGCGQFNEYFENYDEDIWSW